MSKVGIVTALFDIKRNAVGDGRTMDQYLEWFGKTLALNAPMVVYTEEAFREFVESAREGKPTRVVIQTSDEIPYAKYRDRMEEILKSEHFRKNVRDLNRIECYLPMYNVIQYSKFEWIRMAFDAGHFDVDGYFWMDAGCSRFFGGVDTSRPWPSASFRLPKGRFMIQGNVNTNRILPGMNVDDYILDNNCILVGTLFGGDRDTMQAMADKVGQIFEKSMLDKGIVNNEQIALGVLYKQEPTLFKVVIHLDGTHLPLFRLLS